MDGIRYGFPLVNKTPDHSPVERDNYHSATSPSVRSKVEAQISEELIEGRYKIVNVKPHIVSSIGAIEKSNGKVRIIHDASQPAQGSLNSFAEIEEKSSFETMHQAANLLKKGYYVAKLDLKGAYRSVKVREEHQTLAGLKWRFEGQDEPVYMVDTRLPFGARLAPLHFHKLTQAVKHIMQQQGACDMVVYLDDFLIIAPTYEECRQNLNNLIKLVRRLGFAVAWDKIEGPTRELIFLGIELDTIAMELRLPEEKLKAFDDLLCSYSQRKRLSLKQAQHLAGKLNWAMQVVSPGRPYLRIIFEFMKPLCHASHKRMVTDELRAAMEYWRLLLRQSNGVCLLPTVGAPLRHDCSTLYINCNIVNRNITLVLGKYLFNLLSLYFVISWYAAQFGPKQTLNVKLLNVIAMLSLFIY